MAETLELDDNQKDILERFRDTFRDDLDEEKVQDDVFLLQWLIARDFDLEKARSMLSKALEWRRENNMDELLWEKFPIILFPWGLWNCREACANGEKDQLVRYMDQVFEKGKHLMKECKWQNNKILESKCHSQVTVITNMSGFSYWQIAHKTTIEALLSLIRHYEGYHPESLYKTVIFNAPWAFTILFSMMKAIMSSKTVDKIQLFGSDPTQYVPAIRELVPSLQKLPKSFGGEAEEIF